MDAVDWATQPTLERESLDLHIVIYPMPDGMTLAICAEIPPCQVLRHNPEHAFTDVRIAIRKFLAERVAEGRPFTLPDVRTVRFPAQI